MSRVSNGQAINTRSGQEFYRSNEFSSDMQPNSQPNPSHKKKSSYEAATTSGKKIQTKDTRET